MSGADADGDALSRAAIAMAEQLHDGVSGRASGLRGALRLAHRALGASVLEDEFIDSFMQRAVGADGSGTVPRWAQAELVRACVNAADGSPGRYAVAVSRLLGTGGLCLEATSEGRRIGSLVRAGLACCELESEAGGAGQMAGTRLPFATASAAGFGSGTVRRGAPGGALRDGAALWPLVDQADSWTDVARIATALFGLRPGMRSGPEAAAPVSPGADSSDDSDDEDSDDGEGTGLDGPGAALTDAAVARFGVPDAPACLQWLSQAAATTTASGLVGKRSDCAAALVLAGLPDEDARAALRPTLKRARRDSADSSASEPARADGEGGSGARKRGRVADAADSDADSLDGPKDEDEDSDGNLRGFIASDGDDGDDDDDGSSSAEEAEPSSAKRQSGTKRAPGRLSGGPSGARPAAAAASDCSTVKPAGHRRLVADLLAADSSSDDEADASGPASSKKPSPERPAARTKHRKKSKKQKRAKKQKKSKSD